MATPNKTTPTQRDEIARRYMRRESTKAIASDFGISPVMVSYHGRKRMTDTARLWIDKPDVHLIIEALAKTASRHESEARSSKRAAAMARHDEAATNMRRLRAKLQTQVFEQLKRTEP